MRFIRIFEVDEELADLAAAREKQARGLSLRFKKYLSPFFILEVRVSFFASNFRLLFNSLIAKQLIQESKSGP